MRRCTCFKGSSEEPSDTDPGCPIHGYDEDTGESYPPNEEPDYEPDEESDDEPFDGALIDRRFHHYPY